MMQSEVQWFIARDGQQHGPVTDAEMKKFVELGHVKPSDLVWRQGFEDWRPAVGVFPPIAAAASELAQPKSQPLGKAASPVEVAPTPAQPQPAHANSAGSSRAAAIRPAASKPAATRAAVPAAAPAQHQPQLALQPQLQPHAQAQAALAHPLQPQAQGHPQPARAAQPHAQSHAQFEAPQPRAEPARSTSAPRGPAGKGKLIVAAAAAFAFLGGGALAVYKLRGTPATPPGPSTGAPPEVPQSPSAKPAANAAPSTPVKTSGPTDAKLQQVATWQLLRRTYPEWYGERVKEAETLAGEGKTEVEVGKHLVGEIIKLRRQSSKDALAAPPEKLKAVAAAFLNNLKALESDGIAACHAFISRGEIIAVAVELLHNPEKGKAMNAQFVSIFDAIAAGKTTPVKHEAPAKGDYELLAAELGKLGWTQADMQLFASPRALASAPPSRVCTMVQDWFTAHLAVPDAAVQDRLLFETLKPVVGG